jgi:hypothetical protein
VTSRTRTIDILRTLIPEYVPTEGTAPLSLKLVDRATGVTVHPAAGREFAH